MDEAIYGTAAAVRHDDDGDGGWGGAGVCGAGYAGGGCACELCAAGGGFR